jgi:hypothetical protein
MEDTIEICSGCGKMPRAIDNTGGQFLCSRCGNRATMHVTADDYEKVVTDLDQRFHHNIQKKRIEEAASVPLEFVSQKKPRGRKAKKAARPKAARAPLKKTKRTKKR